MRTFLLSLIFLFVTGCIHIQAQINDSLNAKKLSEIEISAQIKPSVSRSTTPLQVIDNTEILQRGIQTVSDAVRQFNGIVLKDYGGIGGLKTIAIRGMGTEHTAVSYDGIMVSNMQSGQVDIGRFSLDNISMISLNIGQSDNIFQTARSFASVGVLNLETVTPQFTTKNYKGYVKIATGSFGLFNPVLDYAQKINNKFILSADGSWQRADGQYPFGMLNGKTPYHNKRKNSDVDIYRTEVNLYNDFGSLGKLKTKIYYFDSERGLPDAVDFQNDYHVERLWNKNFFIQTVYNKKLGQNFEYKSQAKYDYNYTRYRDLYDAYENGKRVDIYKQQEVYWSNAMLYKVNKKINLSLVEDLSYNKLFDETTKFGGEASRPKRYSSLSVFAGKYTTDRFTVTTSLLATYISEKTRSEQNNKTYKKISPAVSLSFVPIKDYNQFRLRASYKDIFRIPTFTEAFYTRSLSQVKPESAKQLNAGMTWIGSITSEKSNYVSVSVDGYYNRIKDKIIIQPSTFYPYTTNLGKVEITGIDAKVACGFDFSSTMGIDLSGSYSYMKAIDITNPKEDVYKNQIIYTPKHSGAASAVIKNPWVNFSYSIIITGERYFWHQNIAKYKMDSYSEHTISINKQLKIKSSELLLQATLLNVWDKQYQVIKNYPMPGRSFSITATLKY